MKISVVILAAGKGKRMQSNIPKVLHKVGGRTLLEHVVSTAKSDINADQVFVVYGHAGERVCKALSHLDVQWVQQQKQLGTAHAVSQPLDKIPDSHLVIVLYGDVPLISQQTIQTLITATPSNGLGLLVANVEDPTGLGRIVRNENNLFKGIAEEKDATEQQKKIQEIFSGILAIPARLLKKYLKQVDNKNAQQEYYLTDVPSIALAGGATVTTVTAFYPDEVLGINDKQQLAKIERLYQLRCANNLMLAGAIVKDPARLDVRGKADVGVDTVIDINVLLEGNVTVGQDCYIGPNVVLRDCVIGDHVTIKENTVIDQAVIADQVTIGPFARLRPGAKLAANTRIGNFVEVKNSQIGEGSKINHLAYVGDSQVGKDVNIGAGVITCNYDGVNKNQTIMEDNAFIGSNSSLVAPVTIAANATVGAGTTVTENVPAGTLTLSRVKQTNIDTWQRPVKKEEA